MQENIALLMRQEIVFLIVIAFGFIAVKSKLTPKSSFDAVMPVVVNLLLPLFFLTGIPSNRGNTEEIVKMCFFIVLLCAIVILLGTLVRQLCGMKKKEGQMVVLMTSSANAGFLGLPLAAAMLGPFGTLYLSLYAAIDNIVLWTYHAAMFAKYDSSETKFNFKKLLSPVLISIAIGFILLAVDFYPQGNVVWDTLTSLGSLAKWFGILYIGASVANVKFSSIMKSIKCAMAIGVLRLVLLPIVIGVVLGRIFSQSFEVTSVMAIMGGLPAMSTLPMLALYFGTDSEYCAQVLIMTTLISFITLPLSIAIVSMIF